MTQPPTLRPPMQPAQTNIGRIAGLALGLLTLCAPLAAAQTPTTTPSRRPRLTRVELESLAVATEREAAAASKAEVRSRKEEEATYIRERLRDGDFHTGDRIALEVDTGSAAVADSFTVQQNRTIVLPALPEISLQGVLRSELQDFVTRQYARILRNPSVKATPLLRVAVMGAVMRPGFYWLPADIPLTDAIMLAGGPLQTSDVNSSEVKRGRRVVLPKREVQRALVLGTTLDDLNLRAGDAIMIADKPRQRWSEVVRLAAAAMGLGLTLYAIGRKL
jgi:protein involved in polysaccharide export with SLBB domain